MTPHLRRWRAPGKLVVAGEYAVLDGAPCLCLALPYGVECAWEPGPDGDQRFVAPALEGAATGAYHFSAWGSLPELPGKPGFGGSAAACVAACLAAGRPAAEALDIHRRVQGGGSGVDVACAIAGGMIRFEAGGWTSAPPLQPLILWSGASARTGPRVQAYLQWTERRPFVRESRDLVDALPADPIAALRALGDLLTWMSLAAGIDYLSPAHARIRALAAQHGGAAKPSGAGGGDCAIALLPDPEAEAAFLARCSGEGLQSIPCAPADPAGPA
jgi:phosphomevalonate kinase